ncbi:Aldehyde/histidinol dehydrogenase [Butyriboletus roseoflavus]|nr:Aldehyde/histidinol dehydrogenase [Butyriboletus roseoflavus]
MTPVDTYTAQATVGDVNKGISNHKNLESNDSALLVFGNGDGGGGALPKMLENLRRIRAVNNTHRELPPVSMGSTVEQFFEDIERDSKEGKTLPVWRGELYLEFHRGTYTSHSSIKKGNRKSEILLRDVERLATLATLFKSERSSYAYPKATIDDCWEKVLLNQFHDVLPGSAIGMVYDDADQLYSEVHKDCQVLLEDALGVLLSDTVPLSKNSPISQPFNVIGVNTTPFARRDIIKIPLSGVGQNLLSKPAQTTVDGKHCYVLLQTQENEALAQPAAVPSEHGPVSACTNGSDHVILRSPTLQLTISQGRITSLYDVKLKRELLPKGRTGGLVIFEDRPNYWDAWDVEIHHLEKPTPLQFSGVHVIAEGPLRASVQTQVSSDRARLTSPFLWMRSQVSQSYHTYKLRDAKDVRFVATTKENSRPLFTFDAEVDWHERHEILKFELPLDINDTVATYESQFGWVQRTTLKNTTLDAAKFEVCGHKFADFSEYGYGVALLSESKYGYACEGNVLRLSLLRAATAPDAEQDQGKHEFSWAVLPHVGSFLESDVPRAAYIFNSPLHLRAVPQNAHHHPSIVSRSPFWLEGSPNVFLETIKRGDDDDFDSKSASKTVILRLYEAFGGHGRVQLRTSPHVRVVDAYLTNLLEDHKTALSFVSDADSDANNHAATSSSCRLDLDFRGFEVKTVKLVIADKNWVPGAQSDDGASTSKHSSWIRETLQATFKTGVTRPLAWRKHQLYQLARLVQDETDAICGALAKDLSKPRVEVLFAEIGAIVERATKSAEQLDTWAKPEHPEVPDWQKGWKPTILKAPKGTVLIISPWNYPVILTFQPLLGAIAAGCCAVIKPSELIPHLSQLIADLLPKYLDSSAYRVVNGAVQEATKLLELQWDHIFYTGNNRVARIIASAAAKYLTPLSLELGGKSPVLVDPAYDMDLAAKRILWGKCNNAGQICVAPDYVLVHWTKQAELVQGFKKAYKSFFPDGALGDSHYGSIVNELHFDRLSSLLDRTKGEKVTDVLEGRKDAARKRIEPTLVINVKDGDSLLEEELFGPILPIIPMDGLGEAIAFINARSHPLVLYAFTEDPIFKQQLIDETQSGGIVFNDTFQQLAVNELPFAGVGESGYGCQVMKYTYDAFTQLRSSIDIPKEAEPFLQLRYPPHAPEAVEALTSAAYLPIPRSTPDGC